MAVGFYALTGITLLYKVFLEGGHSGEPKMTTYDFSRLGFATVSLEDTCMMGSNHSGTDSRVIWDYYFFFGVFGTSLTPVRACTVSNALTPLQRLLTRLTL